MKLKYFGTDGIRGKAYDFLSLELAYNIGNSIKHALGEKDVLIGIDTRESSIDIKDALVSGLIESGLNVYFAGIVSTPMVALYAKEKNMIGLMITASHNLYHDNGIKFFNGGSKLTLEEELLIESNLNTKTISEIKGNVKNIDITNVYLSHLNDLLVKRDLKIVYDSANGANYEIANKIFSKYFVNSFQLGNKPNGKNINLNSGATDLKQIKQYIKNNEIDIGFAFDGDGDRIIVLDSLGNEYDGDHIIYVIANYLKSKGKLTNDKVILTKMSNPGILKALEDENILFERVDVGDKFVFRKMIETNSVLGGEASGHIILRNYLDTGDGILVALYLLKVLDETKSSLNELVSNIKLYPFKMVNIENVNKNVLNDKVLKNYLENIKRNFSENEIFFIRPSGTEPLIRVTMSMKNEKMLKSYMKDVVEFIKERGKVII